MRPQLHVCRKEKDLQRKHMKPVKNRTAKPSGGFWTSTYDETYGSDWIQWLLNEGNRFDDNGVEGYLLSPRKDIVPYVVDSFEDSRKLLEEYGYFDGLHDDFVEKSIREGKELLIEPFRFIDYEKMKGKYDCFHLTRNGFVDCFYKTYPYSSLFAGFDCESTVWFDWAFESSEYVQMNPKKQEDWNLFVRMIKEGEREQ